MLTILTKTVSTLSEKRSADSFDAIESVGTGVAENIGNYDCISNLFEKFFFLCLLKVNLVKE